MSLELTKRIADSVPWLDDVAKRAQPPVQQFLSARPALHNLLDGKWLGVPLHPALTDVPVGAWTSAFVLDLVGTVTGSENADKAADGALAVGVAGALPAAATGTADWRDLIGEERRIATLHALMNVAGLVLNVSSLVQRARGNRAAGRTLSAAGLAISGTAAHFGGELSFGLGVRVNHTFADAPPSEFVAVADETDLDGVDRMKVSLDGTSVLIARAQSGELCAIAGTCSHLGGPLDEGERDGDVVVCPWHGSRFDVCSGAVVEGPAVFPQPRYEVRTNDGRIELRAARSGG
ncbi:MAG TPA: Rieske 2Fe-2S domain-containing protein [Solirubrobacteraceae bacterium]|nr:Rieske 2Fe-2S domain-containing protein [Solirubrobacteraceae bacterium]